MAQANLLVVEGRRCPRPHCGGWLARDRDAELLIGLEILDGPVWVACQLCGRRWQLAATGPCADSGARDRSEIWSEPRLSPNPRGRPPAEVPRGYETVLVASRRLGLTGDKLRRRLRRLEVPDARLMAGGVWAVPQSYLPLPTVGCSGKPPG